MNAVSTPETAEDAADGKKQPSRSGLSLHVYLSPPLRAALDKSARINKRKITAEVAVALENYLADAGLWPPSAP